MALSVLFMLRLASSSTLFPYTTLFRSSRSPMGSVNRYEVVHIIFRSGAGESAVKKLFRDSSMVEQRPVKALVAGSSPAPGARSAEHTSELQSHSDVVCRLLLEKKKQRN